MPGMRRGRSLVAAMARFWRLRTALRAAFMTWPFPTPAPWALRVRLGRRLMRRVRALSKMFWRFSPTMDCHRGFRKARILLAGSKPLRVRHLTNLRRSSNGEHMRRAPHR